jgi:hypothetical protein
MLPIVSSVLGIVNKFIPDKDKQLEAATELQAEMTKQMKLQQEVILNEAKSENWLTSNWRPLFMCAIGFMICSHWFMYDVTPWLKITFGWNIWTLKDPGLSPELWTTMRLGLGGYIGGRTAEKIVKMLKG